MRAVIVASGPSAAGFKPPSGVTVIAVNGAIEWVERADYWFTLDPSAANQKRMANPRAGTTYFAALPPDAPSPAHVWRLRRLTGQGPEPKERHLPAWWLWRWSARCGLTTQNGAISTGNSAYGALGLAYHLGAQRAALVGVDATSSARIEGGRPNNLSHLPLLFQSALGQLPFVNCGHMKSAVPKLSIKEGMKWLNQ